MAGLSWKHAIPQVLEQFCQHDWGNLGQHFQGHRSSAQEEGRDCGASLHRAAQAFCESLAGGGLRVVFSHPV